MTREDILGMEVGRELDALILEYVFNDCDYHGDYLITVEERDFHPSADIKAAWEVVEKMFHTPCSDGDCYQFKLVGYFGAFLAVFEHHLYSGGEPWNKYEHFEGRGKTAPEAICKAALLAVIDAKTEV